MAYNLEFSQTAKKELDSLENDIAIRVIKKLREILHNPFAYMKRLTGSELFSLRIGDYRVLMITQENKLFVTKVGHRKNVYDI